jgi:hypothetical protein
LNSNPDARFGSARDMARALQRTTRLASASDVGEWVQEIAGPDLHARAQRVAAIESTGSFPALSPQESRESVSPSSAPVSMGFPRVARGRLVALPAVAALTLVLAMGLYLGKGRRSDGRAEGATTPSAHPATAPPPAASFSAAASAADGPSAESSAAPTPRAKPNQPLRPRQTRASSPASPSTVPSPYSLPGSVPTAEDFSHVLDSRK